MKKITVFLLVLLASGFSFAQEIVKSEVLPERDHVITLEQRDLYAANYAEDHVIDADNPNKFRFHADQIELLLKQSGAAEIVTELIERDGVVTICHQAADSYGEQFGMILETAVHCPPICVIQNKVNAGLKTGYLNKSGGYK